MSYRKNGVTYQETAPENAPRPGEAFNYYMPRAFAAMDGGSEPVKFARPCNKHPVMEGSLLRASYYYGSRMSGFREPDARKHPRRG